MFTLYQYLHCPFCLRADMVANYSGLSHKKVYLLNDDDQTCHRLIGVKMVPILQRADGSAMGESLDIVKALLAMAPANKQLLKEHYADSATALLAEYSEVINKLVFPRNIMIEQPEFATDSAKAYFQAKKEKFIGMSFASAYSKSAELIAKANTMLQQLKVPELPSERANQLSWDDVLIYPALRNLTMVKGLDWPTPVNRYIQEVATLTNTHLYTAQAV